MSSLFGKWRHRQQDLKLLVGHGPAALLNCFSSVAEGDKPFILHEVYRSMLRHIRSRPKLAARVMVYIDNGYRSSRQAAGTMCYLADMERADHRKVQVLNLPNDWLGQVQDGFGYFYCPVTNAILKRDPPASLSMSTIGTCTFYNAPHPQIWAPEKRLRKK